MKIPGLYQKRGYFYYQPPQKNGERPDPVALRTKIFEEAVVRMAELKDTARIEAAQSPMADLVKTWLRTKAAGKEHRSANTTRTAKPALNKFLAHFRCEPKAVDTAAVARWKTALFAEGLSGATVAGYMRYCQSFFSWLRKQGLVFANPFTKSVFPESVPTRRGKACTKEQRDQLLANCTYPHLKAVLFIGFHAGLRRDEILNLRPEWLIFDGDGRLTHIHVHNEEAAEGTKRFEIKDATPKIVPVSDPLANFLQNEYGLERRPYIVAPEFKPGKHTYRWDFKRRWKTYMKSQDLAWVTPHTMRHTFVSLLLSARTPDRPSTSHLARWTGTGEKTLEKSYAHLFDDPKMINAAN
ncbi:MAG TPA: tyrosine-type recombinase/integrase [Bacteroidia bacterium]|nr:tyrosine-type recombinase/integrase [Bacteroidia bacterium]